MRDRQTDRDRETERDRDRDTERDRDRETERDRDRERRRRRESKARERETRPDKIILSGLRPITTGVNIQAIRILMEPMTDFFSSD